MRQESLEIIPDAVTVEASCRNSLCTPSAPPHLPVGPWYSAVSESLPFPPVNLVIIGVDA